MLHITHVFMRTASYLQQHERHIPTERYREEPLVSSASCSALLLHPRDLTRGAVYEYLGSSNGPSNATRRFSSQVPWEDSQVDREDYDVQRMGMFMSPMMHVPLHED